MKPLFSQLLFDSRYSFPSAINHFSGQSKFCVLLQDWNGENYLQPEQISGSVFAPEAPVLMYFSSGGNFKIFCYASGRPQFVNETDHNDCLQWVDVADLVSHSQCRGTALAHTNHSAPAGSDPYTTIEVPKSWLTWFARFLFSYFVWFSMKYPQLVSMPSEVSDWLEEQLDARGIDSIVYTRYILSLLHRDPVDFTCSELDQQFSKSTKVGKFLLPI